MRRIVTEMVLDKMGTFIHKIPSKNDGSQQVLDKKESFIQNIYINDSYWEGYRLEEYIYSEGGIV
jgi:hypothetical protein